MEKINNPFIQKLFKEKEILVSYVRDELGFKKGAVIAYKKEDGTYNIGASSVHDLDYLRISGNIFSIPVFQCITKEHPELKNLFIRSNSHYDRPNFDREKAIAQAIKNSKNKEWATYDNDIIREVSIMTIRARRYFKDCNLSEV